uniref:ABC transporter ATP-binding protein n=1 Tax=Ignisphaera aggregans TaxID=334771 RepID=A0A7J2U0V9_9CREN
MEIVLKGIWHSYDNQIMVLKRIDLEFKEPGIYVVLGPNGAGKTTLMKITSLILRPLQGVVLVEGVDFWGLDKEKKEEIRKSIVYVHDKPILLRGSVRDNISIGMKIRGKIDEDLIDHYIKRYSLAEVQKRSVHKLSAGQAKAISIIRALVLKPQVLVLDEPFVFLDDSRARILVEDIVDIVNCGGKVLIATHYIHKELRNEINYVIELVSGEIKSVVKIH